MFLIALILTLLVIWLVLIMACFILNGDNASLKVIDLLAVIVALFFILLILYMRGAISL